MAIEKVREHLKKYNMEDKIREFELSTSTVSDAALALSVNDDQIAKTLSFMADTPILIVISGMSKIDSAKYKKKFGLKAKMLDINEVENLIGHKVGGVCPFGINDNVKVYLDVSLKRHAKVFPACGTDKSAIELTIEELEKTSNYVEWVDVCKELEIRDDYDDEGNVIGTYCKGTKPTGNALIVIILIQNSKNEILLQKRSVEKGGLWALTGGHPKTKETSMEGIIAEVSEELGIDISNDNVEFIMRKQSPKRICDLYYLVKDIDIKDCVLQAEEVEEVKWFTKSEVEKLMQEENFHQTHALVYKDIMEIINGL